MFLSQWNKVRFRLCAGLALALSSHFSRAQDLSYTYDDSGNLKTVGKVDTGNDPWNCGSIGNQCNNGAGMCVSGKCVAPPCPPGGCGMVPVKQPTKFPLYCAMGHCGVPDEPQLVAGGLHGQRVCGDFAALAETLFFDCDPLPSNENSGWLLTPQWWVDSSGKSQENKAVVLTISTPSQTEIFIDFESESGGHFEQVQVTRSPGDAEVEAIGAHGQVAVVMSDDGMHRSWTLQLLVNMLTDFAELHIFTVGSSGTTNGVRSNPLNVWLLRDSDDRFPLGHSCSANSDCISTYCDGGPRTSETNQCMPLGGTGGVGTVCSNDNQCASNLCGGLHDDDSGAWHPGLCSNTKAVLGESCTTNPDCASGHCDRGDFTSKTSLCLPSGNTGQKGDPCTADNQCSNSIPLKCMGAYVDVNNKWHPGDCQ